MSSHGEGKRPAVPKFSSFKPKTAGLKDQVEESSRSSRRSENDGPRTSQGHTSRTRDRHRSGRDAPDKSTTRLPDQPRAPQQHQNSSQNRSESALYVLDPRGDPLIRRYGTNDRRTIPNYRRYGFGRVLGFPGSVNVDRSGTQDEFFVRTHTESRSLFGSDRKSILAAGGARSKSAFIGTRQEPPQNTTSNEDYVSLSMSRKRKRDGNASEPLSDHEDGPSYRSIHGKSKVHEHSDSDAQDDSDSSQSRSDLRRDDPLNLITVTLTRRTRDSPDDISAWLELVDHQDTLLQVSRNAGRGPTSAEIRSYADIKLSLLEEALTHAEGDTTRQMVDLKIMREGSKVWDPKTTAKRWEAVMQRYPNSFDLWKAYTDYQQSTLASFRYESIKENYQQQLRALSKEVFDPKSSSDRVKSCEHVIYVFLRLTRFIADAGYAELAAAAWQATLETTFSRPAALQYSNKNDLSTEFQEFWESEVPRIGEHKAKGWAFFAENKDTQELPDPKPSQRASLPSTRDRYKAWSAIERERARGSTLPARTMDDGAEDDPFRTVVSSDLEHLILYLPTEVIAQTQYQVLDAFLVFCQLPPAFSFSTIIDDMLRDNFIVRGATTLSSLSRITKDGNPNTDQEAENTRRPEFFHSYSQMRNSPEVLFSSSRWFRYLHRIRDHHAPDKCQWVTNTLRQLCRTLGVKELGSYYLALEAINEPGSERKIAKALLKQNSLDINLYLGYSTIEWDKGDKITARNVLSAAMSLSAVSPHDRLRLGLNSAWLELEDGNLAQSILEICNSLEHNHSEAAGLENSAVASSAQILKTRQLLTSNRDYLLSSGDPPRAVVYAKGLALLEYLTQQSGREPRSGKQGHISSAISNIAGFFKDLASREQEARPEHEELLQFAARLLYHHASHGPFRSGFLREQLAQYISFFPRNTIFLSLFAWREARLSINDRVRSLLDDVVLVGNRSGDISSHAFAIRYELQTGNVHSARAAYERALTADACDKQPELWISYVRFCHDRRELQPKAKEVFYRAIQACPWSKQVYMEGFETLVGDLDSAELKSVYNTICEKGLRIHIEMEDFLAQWRRGEMGEKRAIP